MATVMYFQIKRIQKKIIFFANLIVKKLEGKDLSSLYNNAFSSELYLIVTPIVSKSIEPRKQTPMLYSFKQRVQSFAFARNKKVLRISFIPSRPGSCFGRDCKGSRLIRHMKTNGERGKAVWFLWTKNETFLFIGTLDWNIFYHPKKEAFFFWWQTFWQIVFLLTKTKTNKLSDEKRYNFSKFLMILLLNKFFY